MFYIANILQKHILFHKGSDIIKKGMEILLTKIDMDYRKINIRNIFLLRLNSGFSVFRYKNKDIHIRRYFRFHTLAHISYQYFYIKNIFRPKLKEIFIKIFIK